MNPGNQDNTALAIDALIQKALEHFAGPKFYEDLVQARREFFEDSGVLDERQPQFELRMRQFFDWYFFSRSMSGFGRPPLGVLFETRELRFSPEEIILIDKLQSVRHSLFQFLKIKDNDIYLKDLIKNEKIVVKNSPYLTGFAKEEYFEARLITVGENFYFMKGFCFHPSGARSFINKCLKKNRKNVDFKADEFLLSLLKMRYRFERYRHLKMDQVYRETP